jgi:hypothetical protein
MSNYVTTGPYASTEMPAWLADWEKLVFTGEVPLPKSDKDYQKDRKYKWIQLYKFKFMDASWQKNNCYGYTLKDSKPDALQKTISAEGVSQEFARRLIEAQQRMILAFAAGKNIPAARVSETDFAAWCKGVSPLSGWQFKASRHSFGIAIDLNAKNNPYVATGVLDEPSTYGGEGYASFKEAKEFETLRRIRRDALNVYDRAVRLVHGEGLNRRMHSDRAGDSTTKIWEDISFPRANTNSVPGDGRLPWNFDDETTTCFEAIFESNKSRLRGAAQWKTRNDRDALYQQIVEDYDTIRLVMVDGSLSPATGRRGLKAHGAFASSTRDPCYGFLSIPKEVAVGLRCQVKGKRIEWGACDWRGWSVKNERVQSTSGDIMHFHSADLEIAVTSAAQVDASDSSVFYVRTPGAKK